MEKDIKFESKRMWRVIVVVFENGDKKNIEGKQRFNSYREAALAPVDWVNAKEADIERVIILPAYAVTTIVTKQF